MINSIMNLLTLENLYLVLLFISLLIFIMQRKTIEKHNNIIKRYEKDIKTLIDANKEYNDNITAIKEEKGIVTYQDMLNEKNLLEANIMKLMNEFNEKYSCRYGVDSYVNINKSGNFELKVKLYENN